MSEPVALLNAWLDCQLDAPARAWLDERRARLAAPHADRDLYMAVGLVPRALGKDDLRLDAGDLAAAHTARPGWDPTGLSVDQAARLALEKGDLDEGRAHARRLLRLDPKSIVAIHNLALIAIKRKRFDAASAWIARGRAVDPTDAGIRKLRTLCFVSRVAAALRLA